MRYLKIAAIATLLALPFVSPAAVGANGGPVRQIAKTLHLDAIQPAPRKYRVAPHSVASFPTLFGTGRDIEMGARVNGKPIPEGVIDSGGGFTADFRGRGVWITLICTSPTDCRVQIANSRAHTVTVRVAAATS